MRIESDEPSLGVGRPLGPRGSGPVLGHSGASRAANSIAGVAPPRHRHRHLALSPTPRRFAVVAGSAQRRSASEPASIPSPGRPRPCPSASTTPCSAMPRRAPSSRSTRCRPASRSPTSPTPASPPAPGLGQRTRAQREPAGCHPALGRLLRPRQGAVPGRAPGALRGPPALPDGWLHVRRRAGRGRCRVSTASTPQVPPLPPLDENLCDCPAARRSSSPWWWPPTPGAGAPRGKPRGQAARALPKCCSGLEHQNGPKVPRRLAKPDTRSPIGRSDGVSRATAVSGALDRAMSYLVLAPNDPVLRDASRRERRGRAEARPP